MRGGKRDGAGRPANTDEDLFEIYKAVEEWRRMYGGSVAQACEQIADLGGLRWADGRGRPITTAVAIRRRYYRAVTVVVAPARRMGITLTGVISERKKRGNE